MHEAPLSYVDGLFFLLDACMCLESACLPRLTVNNPYVEFLPRPWATVLSIYTFEHRLGPQTL